jgi:CheY-like chemotaxis protein
MILLIDDDPVNNMVNTRIIQKNTGLDVMVYDSARDALHHLSKSAPAEFPGLIFLDINMPDMDGWKFLEALHALPLELREECRIVMLTSSIDIHDIKKAKTYPFVQDFISKPLTRDEVLKCWAAMC